MTFEDLNQNQKIFYKNFNISKFNKNQILNINCYLITFFKFNLINQFYYLLIYITYQIYLFKKYNLYFDEKINKNKKEKNIL